jgi:phage/plasmid primase-like uncharacterized protein
MSEPVLFIPKRTAIAERPIDARGIWQRWFDRTEESRRQDLAQSLGVDADCLRAIGCAWSANNAFAFPMKDAGGNVIGIRLRNEQGEKWAVKGSRSGLFVPSEYSWLADGNLYLVEGPTDLAAAMTIGLRSIGRPACLGQENLILAYLQRNQIARLVIVTDNDEPGLRGAEKLQAMLSILSCIWVPPAKDMREFVNYGGTYTTVQSCLKDMTWTKPQRVAA